MATPIHRQHQTTEGDSTTSERLNLREVVRSIPDYPKPGIIFRDITPILGHADALRQTVDDLAEPFRDQRIAKVVGLEARGFIFGGMVALELGAGFVPLRKPGKLPHNTDSEEYALEYGTDSLHIHTDAITPGERVLIVDDLIATGGTVGAAVALLNRAEADIVNASLVIDLPDLGGADRVRALGVSVTSLIDFAGH